jgi:LPXTG-motif cell wall-anchored protein
MRRHTRSRAMRRVLILLALALFVLPAAAAGQEEPQAPAGDAPAQEGEPGSEPDPAEPSQDEPESPSPEPEQPPAEEEPEPPPDEENEQEPEPPPTETQEPEQPPAEAQEPAGCRLQGTESLETDQSEFASGSTVHITGDGFSTSCDLRVEVTRPDGSAVTARALSTTGALQYDYVLGDLAGGYKVRVLSASDQVLASTTFAVKDPGPTGCERLGMESIATDKADYAPGETVDMTGAGYAPSCLVEIEVIRPDGSVVKGDGSFEPGADEVRARAGGTIAYAYVLNGIEGVYQVRVLGAQSAVLAATTFTDQAQVTICHATSSRDNPYKLITLSTNAAINSHAFHTGPIFTPDLPAGAVWGDIIPPIQPGLPDGLNWPEGAPILANGCEPLPPEPLPGAEIGEVECGDVTATVAVTLTNDAAATANARFAILVNGSPQPPVTVVPPGGTETVPLDVTAFEDTFVTVEVQSPPGNPIAESTVVVSCEPPPPIGPLPGVEFGTVDCATLTVPVTLTNHEDATADATFTILVEGEVVVEGVTVAPGGTVTEEVDVSAFVGDEVDITVTSPPVVAVHTFTVDCDPGPGLSAAFGEAECDGETAMIPVTLTNGAAADATFAILVAGDVVAEETVAAEGSETVPVDLTAFEDEVVRLAVVSEDVLILEEFVPVDCAPPTDGLAAVIGDVTCSHATSTVTLTNNRAPGSEVTFRIFVGGAFREVATVSGGESTTIVVGLGTFEDEHVTIEVRARGEVVASETLAVDCHGARLAAVGPSQPRGELPLTGGPAVLLGAIGLVLVSGGLVLARRRND